MMMHLDASPYCLPIFSNGPPFQMKKKKDLTHMALITHVNLDDLRNITQNNLIKSMMITSSDSPFKEMKHQNDQFFGMM